MAFPMTCKGSFQRARYEAKHRAALAGGREPAYTAREKILRFNVLFKPTARSDFEPCREKTCADNALRVAACRALLSCFAVFAHFRVEQREQFRSTTSVATASQHLCAR